MWLVEEGVNRHRKGVDESKAHLMEEEEVKVPPWT